MNTAPKPASDPALASLAKRYQALVDAGQIADDSAQRRVLAFLETLAAELGQQGKKKIFKKAAAAKSLYLWGNVGRGKSMLMDLFFQHVAVEKKRRVHFHAFMQEVHARIHQLRQENQRDSSSGTDPVIRLAQEVAQETTLLCFDELQATDVADATLLYRLFDGLFNAGVIVVSTSNHPPASLYTGGVQRERFAKFIALIEEKMDVASLTSPLDYRQTQIKSLEKRYVWPLGEEADAFVGDALGRLCGDCHPIQATLMVHGHKVHFALYNDSVAKCSFHELCELPLGAADYLALAKRCDTLILTGIPKLAPEKRNEAKRFVTLIDTLYEHKVKLLCTAQTPPEQIYSEGDGAFEFQRTLSRLSEMQSNRWGDA